MAHDFCGTDIQDITVNQTVDWSDDEDESASAQPCPLCNCSAEDDGNGPLSFLRSRYAGMAHTTCSSLLFQNLSEAYRSAFYDPLRARGVDMPQLTPEILRRHFLKHEHNSLRELKLDIKRIGSMQNAIKPRVRDPSTGAITLDRTSMNAWLQLSRAKQDAMQKFEVESRAQARHMNDQSQSTQAVNLDEQAMQMMNHDLC